MHQCEFSRLVIGISSRALFDLGRENQVYEEQGLDAFRVYQRDHEKVVLPPGGALPLVRALLDLNVFPDERIVEVVLMSKNHPDISRRIFNSIEHHKLSVRIASLTGGQPIAPYLGAHGVNVFLSADRADVQSAADAGLAAGLIYDLPPNVEVKLDEIRFAFDGDGVLFSDEADRVYQQKGLDAYFEYERENAKRPLPDGPFAPVLRLLHRLQRAEHPQMRIRVALVTARNVQAHERVLRTLEAWDVRLDEAHFLGKETPKDSILRIFRPHIFFDDREDFCLSAATRVPTAQVLVPTERTTVLVEPTRGQLSLEGEARKSRFLLVCRGYLRKEFGTNETKVSDWYYENLSSWPSEHADHFLEEFTISVKNTPRGEQRRAAGPSNDRATKLISFVARLAKKHCPI
jgi:5'-nucleotidase